MNKLSYAPRKFPPALEETQLATYRSTQVETRPLEEVLSFGHYFTLLKQHAWQIIVAVGIVTCLTIVYCKCVQPIFEATARITMDQRIPTSAIGQQAAVAGPTEVDQIMITEIQIIQSDPVLRPVAEQYHLLQSSGPSFASRVAEKLHLVKRDSQSASQDSDSIGEAPVALSNLSVSRLPNSLLIDIHYRSPDPRLAAAVANGIAQSYLIRGAEMRAKSSMGLSTFMEKQIVELKKNMDNSSRALAGYEKELGVIDPDEKTSILAARLLQLNTQYTEAENDRIRKETEYKQIKDGAATDTPGALYGAAIELSPQATMLSRQEERLRDAEEKFAMAKTIYGPNYAEYKRAANDVAELSRQSQQTRTDISKRIEVSYHEAVNREQMLRASLAQAKSESDRLNAHSAQYQELKREAEASTALYNELFRKIKEAGINAGFESSSIRLADEARPPAFPIFPKVGVFAAVAFLLSLIVSIVTVIVADMFDQSLRDPDKASRITGMQVIGMLPNVKDFAATHDALELAIPSNLDSPAQLESNKTWASSKEFYAESIATLLSTVLLSRSSRPRSILITSASPGEGKSSCAAHLALEHASQGKKTLLIDADLRSPFQQRYFNLKLDEASGWMSTSDTPLSAVRLNIQDSPTLDVVCFKPVTERRAFKYVGLKVSAMLQKAAIEGYDLVIVDAPPMLGLSEPIEIASAVDGVLVIGDASRTNQKAIVNMVPTFERVHARLLGLVLNRFRPELSESHKHYQNYSAYVRRLPAEAA